MALHVLAPGEGEQSGYRDTTLQTRLIVVVVAVVVWALLPVMFLLILRQRKEIRNFRPSAAGGNNERELRISQNGYQVALSDGAIAGPN
jgi:hypothetical protein